MDRPARYCGTCGEEFGETLGPEEEHDCPDGQTDPQWCADCGAELTESGRCDNPHDEDDDTEEQEETHG